VDQTAIALAVVDPRRFVPAYRLRLAQRELAALQLAEPGDAAVLAIVGKADGRLTLNLKAPLVINPLRGLGRQVIANGDAPMQYELRSLSPQLRKTA
jgi:flagellar assembly factor FliW